MKTILTLILFAAPMLAQYVTALTPQPKIRFFTNAGAPCNGCKLWSYQAGTTTPFATYQSAGTGTPNANPVILDSAGYANVWLAAQSYKLELQTAAGSTLWTIDNIADIGLLLKRDLADTSNDALNSSLVGFKPPGGVATTVRAKLIALTYSTLDYGALCDGATDDTVALQAAIDAAASLNYALQIQQGVCMATALTLPSNLNLIGQGMGITTIRQVTNSAVAGTSFITAAAKSNISLQYLTLDGGSQTLVQTPVANWENQNHILKTTDVSDLTISHVEFKNAIYNCWYGDGLTRAALSNSRFVDGWGAGNVGAIGIQAENGASSTIAIVNNYCDGSASNSSCFKLSGTIASKLTSVRVIGNEILQSTGEVLAIELWGENRDGDDNFLDFVVSGNVITGAGPGFGVSICGAGGQNGSVSNNTIRGVQGAALEICGSHIAVTGNTIDGGGIGVDGNFSSGHKNITISGNTILNPVTCCGTPLDGRTGITIGSSGLGTGALATVSHVTVTGNTIYYTSNQSFATRAIWVQSNFPGLIDSISISNNIIQGFLGANSMIGITLQADITAELRDVVVSGNMLDSLDYGIHVAGAGTKSRIALYGNAFTSTVAAKYLTLPSDTVRYDQDFSQSSITMPKLVFTGELGHMMTGSQSTASPNVIAFNNVNFGTELQGGIISVNSKWVGSTEWEKTSTNAYNRAMFLVLGAGAFQVGFGDANNTRDADPADNARLRVDENGLKIGGSAIANQYALKDVIGTSGLYDPGTINAGDEVQTSMAVIGCDAGDVAFAALSTITTQVLLISATGDTNVVRVTIANPSAGNITPGSGTLKVTCLKTN